ncbi:MAG: hypothetical protein IKI76_01630 [Selenomonadaceae bacterium]|nr:hypothetical protein [Selenomonadaceae bacterium]
MKDTMNIDDVKYIIASVMEYAYEAREEAIKNPNSFDNGRSLAYYEVLNTIYNRLDICDQDPREFGYSENWEREFLSHEKL